MERTVVEYIQICEWDSARFLIFSDNVFGNLIYYSHLLPLVVSIVLAFFVFIKNPKILASRWFLATTVLLSVWLFFDLILWATERPEFTMFFWSIVNLVEPIIYVGILFFVYAFIDKKTPTFNQKLIVFTLLTPTVLLASTTYNLSYYDLTNCWREAIEGTLPYYSYFIETIFSLWILGFGIKRFFQFKDKSEKTKTLLITIGAVFFLLSFAMGNVIGSLLVDWQIGQYGLFGIPIFMAVLAYLIVKYHAFNLEVISAEALVAGVWILTFALLFLRHLGTIQVVVIITLVLFTILGHLLVKSVKREVKQRKDLQIANEGQENLIHIMNHQIRGYLAKGRNIFSELLTEQEYGLTSEAKPLVDEGMKSLTEGVDFVQQILKGSSAESGKLVYNMESVDFSRIVSDSKDELNETAKSKSLSLNLDSQDKEYKITGDKIQLKEAVTNLISNSINYTERGEINIQLTKNNNKILLTVKDTGIGISKEDMPRLFQKGGRGKDSLKHNVNSTGYGLAFAKAVVEAHKGRIWVESLGTNKGSTFFVELPLT